MATFSKETLSGSAGGEPIKITGTGSGNANTIHLVPANSTDEVWLYAVNSSGSDLDINLFLTSGTDLTISVPAKSIEVVMPGIPLEQTKTVRAYSTSSSIFIKGFVNRINP